MNLTSKIAEQIQNLWNASNMPALCPGGIIYGLDFSGTSYPFCSLEISLGNTVLQTSQTSAQDYHLRFKVWGNNKLSDASEIQKGLYETFNSSIVMSLGTGNRLLSTCIDTSELKEDPDRNQSNFVMVTESRMILTIQQIRP